MKKVLFASTALVAFSVAGLAQAADPVKLGLGGYSRWMMGYSSNDVAGTDTQDIDIKGTNEIHFKGSTTLDNGIKIGVMVEMEAGGHTDQGTDTIDESYVTVDGSFGRLIMGTEDNGAYLLHVSAPAAAPLSEDAELGLNSGIWILKGTNTAMVTTAIDTTGDSEKLTYVAPSFSGFTVGASYIPNLGSEDNRTTQTNTVSDIVGVAGMYAGTFGSVSLKASLGFATALDDGDAVDHHHELSTGLQLGYGGFTVGGGFRKVWQEAGGDTSNVGSIGDGRAWTVGAMYASGPFAVSFDYYNSVRSDHSTTDGRADELDQYLFTGKYNLGPGVDVIGMIGYVDFETSNADYNDGWVIATGLSVAF